MKQLMTRIQNRSAVVGIVGMGYVGQPLAQAFGTAGFRVPGFDIDKAKVQALTAGRSYIKHIPAQVIGDMRKGSRFTATTDFARIREGDATDRVLDYYASLNRPARVWSSVTPVLLPGDDNRKQH